jgi:hypothetical protein
MSSDSLRTPPVLLTVFRRPDTTREVLEAIRAVRPSRMYVAADGPNPARAGEAEACAKTREIATRIDWPCELRTLFSDRNLGCRLGMITAIDWFFSNEPEGIILEDDVVPVPSFFAYCAELLDRYRTDSRIAMIGGTNLLRGARWGDASYYFSRTFPVWGWATWRRAWQLYDRNMALWEPFRAANGFAQLGLPRLYERAFSWDFNAVASGRVDTWDYQWLFTGLAHNMWSLVPQVNLVSNIGFGAGAVHTRSAESEFSRLETQAMPFPLNHPTFFAANQAADFATIRRNAAPAYLRLLVSVARAIKGARRRAG